MSALLNKQKPVFKSLDEFDIEENIGEGAFGVVYKAKHLPTKKIYALKMIDLSELASEEYGNVKKEIKIHSQLNCPHIVKFYGYFEQDSCVYMVLEYCSNSTLFNYLTSRIFIPDNTIKRFFFQTALGIKYLHDRDFVLRDLKPENILLDHNLNIKICDFGWASELSDVKYCSIKSGTLAYMSPESLTGRRQEKSTDIWALGILLYEMYNRCEPFASSHVDERLVEMKNLDLSFGSNCDSVIKELIKTLLGFSAKERPSIDEVLKSEYLKDLGNKLVYPKNKSVSIEKNNNFTISQKLRKHSIIGIINKDLEGRLRTESGKSPNIYKKTPNTSFQSSKPKNLPNFNKWSKDLYKKLDNRIKLKKARKDDLKVPFSIVTHNQRNNTHSKRNKKFCISSRSSTKPYNITTLISTLDKSRPKNNWKLTMEHSLLNDLYKSAHKPATTKKNSVMMTPDLNNQENSSNNNMRKKFESLLQLNAFTPEFAEIFKPVQSLQQSPNNSAHKYTNKDNQSRKIQTDAKNNQNRKQSVYKLPPSIFTYNKNNLSFSGNYKNNSKPNYNVTENLESFSIYTNCAKNSFQNDKREKLIKNGMQHLKDKISPYKRSPGYRYRKASALFDSTVGYKCK